MKNFKTKSDMIVGHYIFGVRVIKKKLEREKNSLPFFVPCRIRLNKLKI